jgi:Tol biopolymer transport system component
VEPAARLVAYGDTSRVSISSEGEQGYDPDGRVLFGMDVVLSPDGRYMLFRSAAANLVPEDHNNMPDLFLHDRMLGTTERVNVTSDGREARTAEGTNGLPGMTPDGRWVVYASYASDLVPGDTNEQYDVFVRDRLVGSTERVSVNEAGVQGNNESTLPVISHDGRFIAFASLADNLISGDTNQVHDIFWLDRTDRTLTRISVGQSGEQANADTISWNHSMSGDGRVIAFGSWASNLVPNDTNEAIDVFISDLSHAEDQPLHIEAALFRIKQRLQEYGLHGGRLQAMTAKLEAALRQWQHGQPDAAVNTLRAFVNQVNAKRGKKLTQGQADALVAEATALAERLAGNTASARRH